MTQLITLVFAFIITTSITVSADQFKSTGTTDVYFSPKGGATEAIVKEINSAKSEILVQASIHHIL